jgi:hypothetical protein
LPWGVAEKEEKKKKKKRKKGDFPMRLVIAQRMVN